MCTKKALALETTGLLAMGGQVQDEVLDMIDREADGSDSLEVRRVQLKSNATYG
jgi:hypothetical protein